MDKQHLNRLDDHPKLNRLNKHIDTKDNEPERTHNKNPGIRIK